MLASARYADESGFCISCTSKLESTIPFSQAETRNYAVFSDRLRGPRYFHKQLKADLGRPKVARVKADCKKSADLV